MKFYSKKPNVRLSRSFLKSMREWPPVINYCMKVARIQDMPVDSIRIICADAADLFQFLIPKGFLTVIIPVNRVNENTWEFYDSELNNVGRLINQKRNIKVIGEFLLMEQSKWGTTQILKDPVYTETLEKIQDKFPSAIITRHEVV